METQFHHSKLDDEDGERIVIASGGVNPDLAESVAETLGVELADVKLKRHPNDELYVRYNDSVRGKDVFVLQSHASIERGFEGEEGYRKYTAEEAMMEHAFLADAASKAASKSVTVIAPYLIHSRGDRKSRGRELVPAPLIVKFFEAAGVQAMMSLDLHSPQTAEHFRKGTYDHLTAQPELRQAVSGYLGKEALKGCIIVAPDAGAMKNNERHGEEFNQDHNLNLDVVFIPKNRSKEDSSHILRNTKSIEGVENKICITFDDLIDSGNTLIGAADKLKESGATAVYVAATHPVLSGRAAEKLADSAIDKVFVTDTLPVRKAKNEMGDKLEVVPIGPLIGSAIYEIVTDGSISKIFRDQNHR